MNLINFRPVAWSPEFLAFFSDGLTFTPEKLLNLFIKYRYVLRDQDQATALIFELRNLKFAASEAAKKAKGPPLAALGSLVKRLGKHLRYSILEGLNRELRSFRDEGFAVLPI